MTDPFYMLMLIPILGPEYVVWDKESCIDFIRPGKGRVRAEFSVTNEMLEDIKTATSGGDKFLPTYRVEILDASAECVATVDKTLYVRRKHVD